MLHGAAKLLNGVFADHRERQRPLPLMHVCSNSRLARTRASRRPGREYMALQGNKTNRQDTCRIQENGSLGCTSRVPKVCGESNGKSGRRPMMGPSHRV